MIQLQLKATHTEFWVQDDFNYCQQWCYYWGHCIWLERHYFEGYDIEEQANVVITETNCPETFWSPPLPTRWGLWAMVDFNVHPWTGHEGPEREYRHSFTLSLALVLDGVGVQCHALAALPPGKTQHPLYRMLGRPQGRFGQVQKIS